MYRVLTSAAYHYRARMYDPELGRFCSKDPIGYVDGYSLYRAYFATRGLDPSGWREREPGIKDCLDLYGNIGDKINRIAIDEEKDRKNRNEAIREFRQTPWASRKRDSAQAYEDHRQTACRKLRKILDCLQVVCGPWSEGDQAGQAPMAAWEFCTQYPKFASPNRMPASFELNGEWKFFRITAFDEVVDVISKDAPKVGLHDDKVHVHQWLIAGWILPGM